MPITQMVGELFKPITNMIDEVHTSEEENLK